MGSRAPLAPAGTGWDQTCPLTCRQAPLQVELFTQESRIASVSKYSQSECDWRLETSRPGSGLLEKKMK